MDNTHKKKRRKYAKYLFFLELRTQKTVCFLEQIMSNDKYLCIFLCQIESIVYLAANMKRNSC